MLQDVEELLKIRISIAVVGAQFVAGKVLLRGFVQAGCQLAGLCVLGECVGAPASGTMPHSAASSCIDVDTNDGGAMRFVPVTDGHTIDALAAFPGKCLPPRALREIHRSPDAGDARRWLGR